MNKMKDKLNIAVVGATGLVGKTVIKILDEIDFPVNRLTLFASERSAGEKNFNNNTYKVESLNDNSFRDTDIAIFSAGAYVSENYAPIAVGSGCVVVDNGSFWRMNPEVPLVVPEVNAEDIYDHKGIIANPNCSTIQLVMALKPIHDRFGLKRVVVSTYQSVSGAGQKGINQLLNELEGKKTEEKICEQPLAYNTVFHPFAGENGHTVEEIKMMQEPAKILHYPELKIAVTCVRIPIIGGHGESVNIETERPFSLNDLNEVLKDFPGIRLTEDPISEDYPTPRIAKKTDAVYVGRIRRDTTVENGAYLWIVADNIRKGAATNAVQIAKLLYEKDLLMKNQ
jgi:aspartate-semialdehyde dehydrogenase